MKTILMIMTFFMALGSAQAEDVQCYKDKDKLRDVLERVVPDLSRNVLKMYPMSIASEKSITLTREYKDEPFSGFSTVKAKRSEKDVHFTCNYSYLNPVASGWGVELTANRQRTVRFEFDSDQLIMEFDNPRGLRVKCWNHYSRRSRIAQRHMLDMTMGDLRELGFGSLGLRGLQECEKAAQEPLLKINYETQEETEQFQETAI